MIQDSQDPTVIAKYKDPGSLGSYDETKSYYGSHVVLYQEEGVVYMQIGRDSHACCVRTMDVKRMGTLLWGPLPVVHCYSRSSQIACARLQFGNGIDRLSILSHPSKTFELFGILVSIS